MILAIGSAELVFGLLVRFGFLRNWLRNYGNYSLPWFVRNAALAVLPGSVFWIASFFGHMLMIGSDAPLAKVASVALIPVAIAGAVVAMAWAYDPPDIAKPAWLRDREAAAGKPVDPHPRLRRLEFLAAISPLLAIVVGLVAVVLVGLYELVFGPLD